MSTNGKGEAGRSVRMKIEKREGSGIGLVDQRGTAVDHPLFRHPIAKRSERNGAVKGSQTGLEGCSPSSLHEVEEVSANYRLHQSALVNNNYAQQAVNPTGSPANLLHQPCRMGAPSLSASRITRRLHPSPPLPLWPNAALAPAKRRLSRQRHCPYPGGDHILYRMRLCPHGNEWVACGLCGHHDLHYPWSIFCWKVQGDHPIGWI